MIISITTPDNNTTDIYLDKVAWCIRNPVARIITFKMVNHDSLENKFDTTEDYNAVIEQISNHYLLNMEGKQNSYWLGAKTREQVLDRLLNTNWPEESLPQTYLDFLKSKHPAIYNVFSSREKGPQPAYESQESGLPKRDLRAEYNKRDLSQDTGGL